MSPNEELIELVRRIEASVRCLCHQAMAAAAEQNGEGKRLLNKQEAMDYLHITESTYYRWIQEKKLQPRGVLGQDHYYESDLILLKTRRRYRERGL